MAWTAAAEVEAPYDSFSYGNGVQRFSLVGATTGTDPVTIKAAVTAKQIYFKGTISVSAACRIDFKSATAGTIVRTINFLVKGTAIVRCAATKAGELLEIVSDTDVTAAGEILTLPVASGHPVPPDWSPQ